MGLLNSNAALISQFISAMLKIIFSFFLIVFFALGYAQDFDHPQKVEIVGYQDHAMEPFISRDGEYLFFNNRNEPPEKTDLFYAKKIGDRTFQFKGEVKGANSPTLDAVASIDSAGYLFFVSLREYPTTYLSLFFGLFRNGEISNLRPLSGNVSKKKPGWINMDAEISADGETLYFVNALFQGSSRPAKSDIEVAYKKDGEFIVAANSDPLVASINTDDLEYAPSTSNDGLELFFTRLTRENQLNIFVAKRKSRQDPFGDPEVIRAIQGYVEAPSVASNGKTLYYHKKDGPKFSIYQVTRNK